MPSPLFQTLSLLLLTLVTVVDIPSMYGAESRTAIELEDFFASDEKRSSLSLSGIVQHVDTSWFCLQDKTGRSLIRLKGGITPPKPGDEIIVNGHAAITKISEPVAFATNITCVGRKAISPAQHLHIADLDEQRHNLALVCITGTIIDIIPDEIDSSFIFFLVKDGETILPAAVNKTSIPIKTKSLINAYVRLTGLFYRSISGLRKFTGPIVYLYDPNLIEVLHQPPVDIFNAKPLRHRLYLTPRDVSRLDLRSITGRVAAVWEKGRLLVITDDGRAVTVELASDETAPSYGTLIKAVGYPEADILSIKLTRSHCQTLAGPSPSEDLPQDINARNIVSGNWHVKVNKPLFGKLLRIKGTVINIPLSVESDQRILLDADSVNVAIDVSTNPTLTQKLELGSFVEVVGRCILETETWRPENPFPRITGFFLVPRTTADIRVLAAPPWWTPAKLLAVIGIFIALLSAMFAWNTILRRLVERRGRALYREQLSRERSELRVEDRTQLAVELHDSISQNLTGASMQIDTAKKLMGNGNFQVFRHLDIASKTLTSCRQELRNCIWDLRNNSLDEKDLNTAIRRTIELYTDTADLQIRFNVSRSRLSDNATHMLMKIVRELATNAVRHGRATAIRIAGALEKGRLIFSVSDNGSGFDPENHPGIADGHFGLQGIEERISNIGGVLKIKSVQGKGTKVTIWIKSEC